MVLSENTTPQPNVLSGAVALDDGDIPRRIGLLRQDREVQPGGPASEANDLHGALLARSGRIVATVAVGNHARQLAGNRPSELFAVFVGERGFAQFLQLPPGSPCGAERRNRGHHRFETACVRANGVSP